MSFLDDKELQEYRNIMDTPASTEFADGFGWKAVAGALFLGLIVGPATDYLGLVIGSEAGISDTSGRHTSAPLNTSITPARSVWICCSISAVDSVIVCGPCIVAQAASRAVNASVMTKRMGTSVRMGRPTTRQAYHRLTRIAVRSEKR